MNPDQQPTQPVEPPAPTYQPAGAEQPQRRNARKITAIWLLVGPSALIVFSILAYAIANAIFMNTASSDSTELFGQQPVGATIVNIALFIIGTVSVVTWLPGIVIGIILLTTKGRK